MKKQEQPIEEHPLKGILGITVYKGVLVEPYVGGYFVLNKMVKTVDEVDKVIYDAGLSLKNSVISNPTALDFVDNLKNNTTHTSS